MERITPPQPWKAKGGVIKARSKLVSEVVAATKSTRLDQPVDCARRRGLYQRRNGTHKESLASAPRHKETAIGLKPTAAT
jgi:hypothetical protein